jgi:polar amino acid transport system substrate-binding protein
MTFRTIAVATVALAVLVAGCPPRTRLVEGERALPLRVGISADQPPIAFMREGEIVGIEADFARALARELRRPLRFVPLPWEEQIPALLDRRTDVIMAGMTITPAREVRITFGESYLTSGLMALMARRDKDKYQSVKNVLDATGEVGTRRGTTSERFVREQVPKASVVTYRTHEDAVFDLKQGRIDLYVDDAPLIVWLVSENEAELVLLRTPLNQERLGWGFRQDDSALRHPVNTILVGWKADGTIDRIVRRWLPYWPSRDD